MQETKLEVKHDYCIHCGVCVMMQFADNKDGKKVIKLDLPKEQFSLAENCCPVGAIVQVACGDESKENK